MARTDNAVGTGGAGLASSTPGREIGYKDALQIGGLAMRKFLAALVAIAAFTATVALVNSMSGAVEVGMNFNIQDAAEHLAAFIGEPVTAWAADADVPIPDQGLASTAIGALGLAVPSAFAFVVFSG